MKAVEKREGGGPHNWGDEIQAQLDPSAEEQTENTTTDQTTGGSGEENHEDGTPV